MNSIKILTPKECRSISGGVDYFVWSQYGLAAGATLGSLHAFKGPMTGAALAFKPFEMVLHGIAGAGIGIGVGLTAGFLYQVGANAYNNYSSTGSWFNMSSLLTLAAL